MVRLVAKGPVVLLEVRGDPGRVESRPLYDVTDWHGGAEDDADGAAKAASAEGSEERVPRKKLEDAGDRCIPDTLRDQRGVTGIWLILGK